MAAEWYHQHRGIQAGPVDSRQLRRLAEAGIVTAETLVRRGDSGRWVPAEQVRGLFQRSTPAPSLGATPPLPKSGTPSKGVSGETPIRHGLGAAAVNEASKKPERVWPVTLAAISAGCGAAFLLLWAVAFHGGSTPQQQAGTDQPPLAVAQSGEPGASASAPQPPALQPLAVQPLVPKRSETPSLVFTRNSVEDLAAALDRGHVALEAASGTGASSGLAVNAYLINQRNTEVSLDISLRQPLFLRNRGRGQSMFVIKVYLRGGRYQSDGPRSFISLQPKLRTPVSFIAYCADFDKDNPSNTEELVRDTSPVSLLPLLQSISNYESSHPNENVTTAAQTAIWLAQGVSIGEIRTKFEVNRAQELLAREFLEKNETPLPLPASDPASDGVRHMDAGNYDRSIAECTESIRRDPENADAYFWRGQSYRLKGDYDRAISDFTQVIRLDPKDAGAYYFRGQSYCYNGDYDSAIADCTEAIRLDPENALAPQNAAAYFWRGQSYRLKNDYDRAVADYSEVIRLDPKDAGAYYFRGESYCFKGDHDSAIADFTQAIRLDPTDADVYHLRGNAYCAKRDYDSAIADFTEAIRLDPKNADVYHDRGAVYQRIGLPAAAERDSAKEMELRDKL